MKKFYVLLAVVVCLLFLSLVTFALNSKNSLVPACNQACNSNNTLEIRICVNISNHELTNCMMNFKNCSDNRKNCQNSFLNCTKIRNSDDKSCKKEANDELASCRNSCQNLTNPITNVSQENCSELGTQINNIIANAKSCNLDSDCEKGNIPAPCSFSRCTDVFNRNSNFLNLANLTTQYDNNCHPICPMFVCANPNNQEAKCENHKCILSTIQIPQCNSTSGKICGSDGVTYNSECDMIKANATEDHTGECVQENCNDLSNQIKQILNEAKDCKKDSDCVIGNPGAPCGFVNCINAYNNKTDLSILRSLSSQYNQNCKHACPAIACPLPSNSSAQCINNQCIVK